MSLTVARGRLVNLTRDLNRSWEETRHHWRDAKAAEFEKKYIDDLNNAVNNAVTVLGELDDLLRKIRKDCAE